MELRFWGTRGSIATPGQATTRYGGNTSCVEVVTKAGHRFIFDAGTGLRVLGAYLMANAPKPIVATMMLTHTHWDHIQGFPFFTPLFIPGNRFTVYGPHGSLNSLPEVLAGQMEYTYFPVELSQLGAEMVYREVNEGSQKIDGVRLSAQALNHPARTLGYRLEVDGASLLYLCDHEPYWEGLWHSSAEPGKMESILHEGDRRHAEFMQNADVVIHDSQYTPEEYPSKKNWGHATWAYVTQIAAAANVKQLYLTHHDPTHDDDFLDRVQEKARALAKSLGSPLQVSCAREGLYATFEHEPGERTAVNEVKRVRHRERSTLLIQIVDDDEDLRILAQASLTRAGYKVLEASGGAEGLEMMETNPPDLLILDLDMPGMNGLEVLRRLRRHDALRTLPVIVLTAHGDEHSIKMCFEEGATDCLVKPFTAPQLDARVQSSLTRAQRHELQD